MKEYKVTFGIHKDGEISHFVSAKDNEDAEDKAYMKIDNKLEIDIVDIQEIL